jgi:hypothetical protein
MKLRITLLSTIMAATLAAVPLTGQGQAVTELGCIVMNTERVPLVGRESPLDSVTFSISGGPVKICYGRPSARGRTMIGGPNIPYGQLWRMGANEPTMIHTSVPLVVAGIYIEPGSYSLYTIPGRGQWRLILNRSISQWGHESNYTALVREGEVGRASVPSERRSGSVEQLTFRVQPAGRDRAVVFLEWERTQVTIPIAAG